LGGSWGAFFGGWALGDRFGAFLHGSFLPGSSDGALPFGSAGVEIGVARERASPAELAASLSNCQAGGPQIGRVAMAIPAPITHPGGPAAIGNVHAGAHNPLGSMKFVGLLNA